MIGCSKPIIFKHLWIYSDWQGKQISKVIREDFKTGKNIWQHKLEKGYWVKGRAELNSIAPYNWENIKDKNTIYICEGEPIVDLFTSLGLPAITVIGGSKTKWQKTYTEAIANSQIQGVVLCPDQDEKGVDYMDEIAAALRRIVRVSWSYAYPDSFYWRYDRLPPSGGVDYVDYHHDHDLRKNPPTITQEKLHFKPAKTKDKNQDNSSPKMTLSEIKEELFKLSNLDISKFDQELALIGISQVSGLTHYQIDKIYQQLLRELEQKENTTATDISSILKAQAANCEISELIPNQLAQPIKNLAGLLNLRPELYLQALITTMATLVNPATRIVINQASGFDVSPNIFSGIVANSSQKKSPVLKAMINKPLSRLRKAAKDEFLQQKQEYNEQIRLYQKLKKDNPAKLEEHFPNGEPNQPERYKIYYQDNSTTEGVINQLEAFPDQGTLLLRDELAGLFKSANAYRNGRGSDTEDLLKFYDGGSHTVLRAGGVRADLDNVLLSIIGGIQPAILSNLLGNGDDDNGQWARFDFIVQPVAPSVLPESGHRNGIDLTKLIAWIYEEINYHKAVFPEKFYLSESAYKVFKQAYDHLEKKRCQIGINPAMSHVYGKAEGKIAKYALQFHILNWLFNHDSLEGLPDEIGIGSIEAAIKWINFLTQQVKGLYAQNSYGFDGLTEILAKIASAAKKVADWVTPKIIKNCLSSKERTRFSAQDIKQFFRELKQRGFGETETSKGTLKFRYSESQVSTVSTEYPQWNPMDTKLNPKLIYLKLSPQKMEKNTKFYGLKNSNNNSLNYLVSFLS